MKCSVVETIISKWQWDRNHIHIVYTGRIGGRCELGEHASGLLVLFTLIWQPRLHRRKRYAAIETAIIERVVLFSHIAFSRNCVSTGLGERMLCNIWYPNMLCESTVITDGLKRWCLVRKLLLWAFTALISLREQTRVAFFSSVRGKMPCWHKTVYCA